MTNNEKNILTGVVILAAGSSSRMKSAKPFLIYDENRMFIDKIIDEYINFKCAKIIVIINNKNTEWEQFKKSFANNNIVEFIENNHQEYERFYSVKLGLSALTNIDYCFIQNVDNPFVDTFILDKLFNSKSKNAYCVPEYQDKGGHPILINKSIMNNLIALPNDSNLKDALKGFERINVVFDTDKVLVNINNQDDYNFWIEN